MIDSHIQVPKGILKNFRDPADQTKKVWWLDIITKEIKRHPTKSLGAKSGYFSAQMEQEFNQYAENDIARFGQRIRAFCEDSQDNSIFVSEKDIALSKRYIKMLVARSSLVFEKYLQSTPITLCFSEQSNHDFSAGFALASQGKWDAILHERRFSLLVNYTNYHLVLPRNGFYFFECEGRDILFAPLSPKGGILFLPKDYPEADPSYMMHIADPDQIRRLNLHALKYEYLFHGAFVASDCQEPLVYLKKYLQEHEQELLAFWSLGNLPTNI